MDNDDDNKTNINNSSGTMPLSLDAHTQGKCKLIKCSRHFNQNGLISMGDRIYANSTTTDQCNYSECSMEREKKNLNKTNSNLLLFDYSRLGTCSAGTILSIMVGISGVIYDAQRYQYRACVHGSAK